MEMKWLQYARNLAPTDYCETISRLEFLAMGLEELRERDQFPESLKELADTMSSIEFKYTSTLFGKAREMRASDNRLFQVPFAESTPSHPEFQLVDQRGKKLDADQGVSEKRKLGAVRKPPFPMIMTTGLEPRNVSARWARVNRGNYQCVFAAE